MDKQELERRRKSLEEQIVDTRQEIRTDRMDMSFGEIMSMYENDEIIINPEFQRAFRWDEERQTKFIESLLVGIPIPSIFVAENENNIWELVDGLQRLSTIFAFFGILKDEKKNNLTLTEGSLLKELEGFDVDTIPIKYKLLLKRAVCRVEVIRFDSQFDMRYELFNRLNTGGAELSEQEIRNCIFRGYDNTFNAFINKLGSDNNFQRNLNIREEQAERMYYQELVLRFFTLKNAGAKFEGDSNIQQHMSKYMLEMSKNPNLFDFKSEEKLFKRVVKLLNQLGDQIFKLERVNFSTSMYDSILINFANNIDYIETLAVEEVTQKIEQLKSNEDFRKNTRSASSGRGRVSAKIELAKRFFTPTEE
ncbi:DUF262 domain-containing protein [Paenibacillus sp. URB8-2]|uniref:DUF262 domain-containing protein n=1 Tax=Paenibacillus sp. URB8-2 TaxID=2741301 RepID=UPI0015BFF8B4|nr:DUF262 domain-containing protein [Paenibacillus sp. URB8-2]BCG58278.1 hypothetical protein PUR_17030 [Paenibacillus sp. URB8-2]